MNDSDTTSGTFALDAAWLVALVPFLTCPRCGERGAFQLLQRGSHVGLLCQALSRYGGQCGGFIGAAQWLRRAENSNRRPQASSLSSDAFCHGFGGFNDTF